MASVHRLTALQVSKTRAPGLLADGGGLFLQIQHGRSGDFKRSWIVRFSAPSGRRREMGLGSAELVSLSDAREHAREARKLAKNGIDPIDARNQAQRKARFAAINVLTFKEAAEAYVAGHGAAWSNDKHRKQWFRSLELHAFPVLGKLPVAEIDVSLVLQAIEPIWATTNETASRVRGRIEVILDWCAVRGYRSAENPARWRGHLQRALPSRSKTAPVRHHPAMSIDELPAFMVQLGKRQGLAPRALTFCILTATRTSETLNARWEEFDFKAGAWTLPAERMKARRPHRVPLTDAMVAILDYVDPLRTDTGWVFPSPMNDTMPLSNMCLLTTLRRMERNDTTVHGFRSVFRDWVAERTDFPGEVAEAALAHIVGDRVEAAYRRGDLFDKRRSLMSDWAEFALSKSQHD